MQFHTIVVVCQGNICRSPLAEQLLHARLPSRALSSAGLGALVGQDTDPTVREVAAARGIALAPHSARQLDGAICAGADLLLVMTEQQRVQIQQQWPQASGKVMLLGQWTDKQDIPDPYRRDRETHEAVFERIERACEAWAARLVNQG